MGFKNNATHERFWEGRKIWRGIVNESPPRADQVVAWIEPGADSQEARELRGELIYRHMPWINGLAVPMIVVSALVG